MLVPPPPRVSAPLPFNPSADDLLPLYLLRFERLNTRRAYAADLQQFFGSDMILLEQATRVSFVEVNAYLRKLEVHGTAPATLQRKTATIRGFFSWLLALGMLTHNPADRQLIRRGRRSSSSDHVITVLTRDQARALLDAVDLDRPSGVRDRALLSVLLHGVIRRSEARGMDFEHLRRVGEHHVLLLPQTKGGSDQYVKLPAHVADAIQGVREAYGFDSGAVWRALSRNHYGNRLSAHSIYTIALQHAKKAGITEAVGAHTLRHTGCTLAIEAGASLQQVQSHARHKSIQTTMMYVHQRDRLRDSAADYIDI